MRRKGSGFRLVPVAGPSGRVTEKEREEVRDLLGRAQREGRFGATDVYEQRLERLARAVTKGDLDALVADLDELVPEPTRAQLLAVVRRAHADGRLAGGEFYDRTERCLGPLTRGEATALVSDLGYRIERAKGPLRIRTLLARAAPPALAGVCSGTAVLAVPVVLGAGLAHWVPLAVGTAVFGTACASGVALAWRLRPVPGWRASAQARGVRGLGRETRPDGPGAVGSGR